MVSTTWVQFIKGSLLVALLLAPDGHDPAPRADRERRRPDRRSPSATEQPRCSERPAIAVLPETGGWAGKPYVRLEDLAPGASRSGARMTRDGDALAETQTLTVEPDGARLVNGLPQGKGEGQGDLRPVGHVLRLPGGRTPDGSARSAGVPDDAAGQRGRSLWGSERDRRGRRRRDDRLLPEADARRRPARARRQPDVQGRAQRQAGRQARLPLADARPLLRHRLAAAHPDPLLHGQGPAAARKSTVVGIASIGFFYVLTLFLGLGRDDQRRARPHQHQHGRPAARPELQRTAVRDHLGRSPSRPCSARSAA